MRFAVEAWAPEYGAPTDSEALAHSDDRHVDAFVEATVEEWEPRNPAPAALPFDDVLFVDGVQRVDALVWVAGDDGLTRTGLCGSFAAGSVRCAQGRAVVEQVDVGRGLFCHPSGADHLATRHGCYPLHQVHTDDPVQLRKALHDAMIDLEVEVARAAGSTEVVLVDGPLRKGHGLTELVGFIKTHAKVYGPRVVPEVVAALQPGQRTPLLVVGEYPRFTWYLRLPGPINHDWSGIVRLQASTRLALADVAHLADRLCRTLPRFASEPHKDPRAPQNLVPIGGLERTLRRRLGDPRLLQRALRDASARSARPA
jgi:uncharacterized protein